MPFKVKCPGCGAVHQVADHMAGTRARCRCGRVLVIPRPAEHLQPLEPSASDLSPYDPLGGAASSVPSSADPFASAPADPAPLPSWSPSTVPPWQQPRKRPALSGRQLLHGMFGLAGGVLTLLFSVGLGIFTLARYADLAEVFAVAPTAVRAGMIVGLLLSEMLYLGFFISGVGIIIGSICRLLNTQWRLRWADAMGAVVSVVYLVFQVLLTVLAITLFFVAVQRMPAERRPDPAEIIGAPLALVCFTAVLVVVPALLIISYAVRRRS